MGHCVLASFVLQECGSVDDDPEDAGARHRPAVPSRESERTSGEGQRKNEKEGRRMLSDDPGALPLPLLPPAEVASCSRTNELLHSWFGWFVLR